MNPMLPPILADLDRMKTMFDPTVGGLGPDLIRAFTDGVKDTIAAEESPDGEPWEQLSPDYEARKAVDYPGEPIGFREKVMFDPAEIEGTPEVAHDSATVTYGITEQAKDEAEWFQEGDDDQPPRPFWGFTGASEDAASAILDARFDDAHR